MKTVKLIMFMLLIAVAMGIDDIVDLLVVHIPREIWIMIPIVIIVAIGIHCLLYVNKKK